MNSIFYKPYVEVELRLGKKSGSSFLSNIGFANFTKLKTCLDSHNNWESKVDIKSSDEFFDDIRKTDDMYIRKKKLHDNDVPLESGFCTRFVISQETPVTENFDKPPLSYIRDKHRYRYEHSHWYIDLTHITNLNTYELEIELKSISYAKKHSYDYIHTLLSNEMNNLISCANL